MWSQLYAYFISNIEKKTSFKSDKMMKVIKNGYYSENTKGKGNSADSRKAESLIRCLVSMFSYSKSSYENGQRKQTSAKRYLCCINRSFSWL